MKRRSTFIPRISISNVLDGAKTAQEILSYCLKELRAESGSLFAIEENSETLCLLGAIGARENHHCGKSIRIGDGVSGFVASTKRPLLVADSCSQKGITPRQGRHPVETFMSCPVLKDSSVLGVINVAGRKTGRAFSKKDLQKLQSIAAGCATMLDRMLSYRSTCQMQECVTDGAIDAHENYESIERQLEDLRTYNAIIVQHLSDYIFVFDRHLNIIHCNKDSDFALGSGNKKDVTMKGHCVLDLPFDVDRGELKKSLEKMIVEHMSFGLKDVRLKGSDFHIANLSFSPFFSPEGNILGGLLFVEDVTKTYEMRQRLNEAERFSLIGSLTSMITHEVNNPLDGIMRLINISLGQIKDDDPTKEYLVEAQKGLQRIASLVRSLLSFSRKSISLDAEVIPLNRLVDSAISTIRNRNDVKDISFHVKLATESPNVRTNDFYQVFSNLLSNSFDAITREQGNIGIETQLDDDELHIIVEDDGCGIPKHLQSRIFKTFVTTKERGKGTGLGLAIVKKIVEKYDGQIAVKSDENIGTRMHLTFSRCKLTS
ncbi:GAF domain-containing protein [Candidatus Poribacteria bacterium]|nr:GAF domain-containing protein [Candidatus Poribacteria bacterium]